MPQNNSKIKNRPAVWIVFRMVLIQTDYVSYRSATLTNAMFLSPSTPSSEKDPPRFNKSLSFSTETGILSVSSCPGTRTETGSRFQKQVHAEGEAAHAKNMVRIRDKKAGRHTKNLHCE